MSTPSPPLPEFEAYNSVARGVLDAGNLLKLLGPKEKQADFPRYLRDGGYASSLNIWTPPNGEFIPLLEPGRWTISGEGGPDVGPFSASITLPDPPVWTNKTHSMSRGEPLVINWTGGDSDLLFIRGWSDNRQNYPNYAGGSFVCATRTRDRTFTVPSSVLSQLPAGTGAVLLVVVNARNDAVGDSFTAPLTRGGNLDYGMFVYTLMDGASVRYE